MRQYFLVFGLLAGVPVGVTSDDASVGNGTLARQDAEAPVRIDTGVGAFLVREGGQKSFDKFSPAHQRSIISTLVI